MLEFILGVLKIKFNTLNLLPLCPRFLQRLPCSRERCSSILNSILRPSANMVTSCGGMMSLATHWSLCNQRQKHQTTESYWVSIMLLTRQRWSKPKKELREFQTKAGKIYQTAINLNMYWWKIFFLLTHSALHLTQSVLTWANTSGEMNGISECNGVSCNWICVHLGQV